MDVTNGRIHSNIDWQKLVANGRSRMDFKEMEVRPTKKQMLRKPPRISRNETCPCGSGLKFKKCCLRDSGDKRFKED